METSHDVEADNRYKKNKCNIGVKTSHLINNQLKLIKNIGGLSQPRIDVPVSFHENSSKGGRKCIFRNQTCFGE